MNGRNSKQSKSDSIKETSHTRLRYLTKPEESKLTPEEEEKIIEYMESMKQKELNEPEPREYHEHINERLMTYSKAQIKEQKQKKEKAYDPDR